MKIERGRRTTTTRWKIQHYDHPLHTNIRYLVYIPKYIYTTIIINISERRLRGNLREHLIAGNICPYKEGGSMGATFDVAVASTTL